MSDSNADKSHEGGSVSSGATNRTARKPAASPRAATSRPLHKVSGEHNGAASAKQNGAASREKKGAGEQRSGLVGKGLSAGVAAARTVGCAASDGANRAVELGADLVRGSVSAVGGAVGGSKPGPGRDRAPVVEGSMRIPLASASVRVPGPGAVVSLGPVRVTLPTGALYYGGLAALAIGGAVAVPLAAGAALAGAVLGGAVLGRRWLRGSIPRISVFDAAPGSAPRTKPEAVVQDRMGSASV